MSETGFQTWQRGDFTITTDPRRVDLVAVHRWLTGSYWAQGIPMETVGRSITGSIPFSIFRGPQQVGFARVISDGATFAYLADVFVDEAERGHGLSKWLMECVLAHPALQGLRRWVLATKDAHGLYAQSGFKPLAKPERFMERLDPDLYTRNA